MTAPVTMPSLSFDEIHTLGSRVLPGPSMRRSLFWRYRGVWVAPEVQPPELLQRSPRTLRWFRAGPDGCTVIAVCA